MIKKKCFEFKYKAIVKEAWLNSQRVYPEVILRIFGSHSKWHNQVMWCPVKYKMDEEEIEDMEMFISCVNIKQNTLIFYHW